MKVIVKIYPKKNRVSGSGSSNLPENIGFSGIGYTKPESNPKPGYFRVLLYVYMEKCLPHHAEFVWIIDSA